VVALAILSLLAEAIWQVSRKPEWEKSVEFERWRSSRLDIEDKELAVVELAHGNVFREIGMSQSVQL
jgi:hypothetical protein